eukprot:scaffold263712_cov23-Tisochrysis_lutea.AAC.1
MLKSSEWPHLPRNGWASHEDDLLYTALYLCMLAWGGGMMQEQTGSSIRHTSCCMLVCTGVHQLSLAATCQCTYQQLIWLQAPSPLELSCPHRQ